MTNQEYHVTTDLPHSTARSVLGMGRFTTS